MSTAVSIGMATTKTSASSEDLASADLSTICQWILDLGDSNKRENALLQLRLVSPSPGWSHTLNFSYSANAVSFGLT